METNTEESTRMGDTVNGGVVREPRTAMTLDAKLAEAHRDLVKKGEALRRAVTGSIQGYGSSDMAYVAWKQARNTAAEIYSELKVQRMRLSARQTA